MKVLQLIDTLQAGGSERLAVNYANGLSKLGVESHLCTTRDEGSLLDAIDNAIGYLFLKRASTIDIKAILRLRRYVKSNNIDIIHAHSSSYFIASLVKVLIPRVKVVWHDHYGKSEMLDQRPKRVLSLCSSFFSYVFSVNKNLKEWSLKYLRSNNVEYIKNFPVLIEKKERLTILKGEDGKRLLCLANLRDQKNHLMLLEAFKRVNIEFSDWSLHCVGKDFKDEYSKTFFNKIEELNLQDNVHFYDSKSDVLNIISQCQIGLLSSKSEGLPLALLEYGLVKLPVIVTDVGDCKKLVSDNSLGQLVQSNDVEKFADSIKMFISDEDYRLSCAKNFNKKVSKSYSEKRILSDILEIYKSIL